MAVLSLSSVSTQAPRIAAAMLPKMLQKNRNVEIANARTSLGSWPCIVASAGPNQHSATRYSKKRKAWASTKLGASTTAMGLYRLLSWAKRSPEAAVFWEYGINEYNHHSDGQSLESLLYHVEWLIQVCIRERRPLVPVLMRNCAQLNLMDDPYIPALKRLFAAYQVPVLDVQQLLPVLARGPYKPAAYRY